MTPASGYKPSATLPLMPTFSIPSPCSQSWEAMTPTTDGRHCTACAKVVVDFTQLTDVELVRWLHQQSGQATCGRFRADQLERPMRLAPAVAQAPRWRTWVAAAVAVWGLREATAPAAKSQVPVEQLIIKVGEAVAAPAKASNEPPVVIRGVVVEAPTALKPSAQVPLPGVTVVLVGTDLGASTDMNGRFELAIPAETWAVSKQQLTVSSIGYVTQPVPLPAVPTQPLAVALAVDTRELGGLLVVNGCSRPWYTPAGWLQRTKRLLQH